MAWNLFGSSAPPPPFWAEGLGNAAGEAAPLRFLLWTVDEEARHDRHRRALECALLQRGLRAVDGSSWRWADTLRVAYATDVEPGQKLVVLAGHRVDELADGLRHEAGLPVVEGAEAAGVVAESLNGGPELFQVGKPKRWRELVRAEEEQLQEATNAMGSTDAPRRCAAAGTLARLELFDRGPWVEHAVVAWEVGGYSADLAFASLCQHELRWLRVARDPLADRVLGLVWALAGNNWSVEAVARRAGAKPTLDESPQALASRVPSELAAAACGVPVGLRANWRGAASFEAQLQAQDEPRLRAVVALNAIHAVLPRYRSGWHPRRLAQLRELAIEARNAFEDRHPKMRALALSALADIESAQGNSDDAETLRRQALAVLRRPDGRWRDEALAKRLKASLS